MSASIPRIVPGSDFPDTVKLRARRLAAFRCCYCRDRMGHEVHHLIPKEEGGQGVLDNAVLLCVQCHSDYGHREDKRLPLRQARDQWYEVVAKRYAPPGLDEVAALQDLATKNDMDGLKSHMVGLFDKLMVGMTMGSTSTSEVANVGSSMVNSIVAPGSGSLGLTGYVPTLVIASHCGNCGSEERPSAMFCSMCGQRIR
jgi:hypothetical protein